MMGRLFADKSQTVMLAVYVVLFCGELLYFALQMLDRPRILFLLALLFAISLVAVLGLFCVLKLSKPSLETTFLISVVVIGVCYVVAIGPLKSNDEPVHYIGAYWLSDFMMGLDSSALKMRADDLEFYELWETLTLEHKGQFSLLGESFSLFASDSSLVTYADNIGNNILNSPPQMYLFPALGLTIGRILGLSSLLAYYLGRILALVSFAVIACVAVRNTPIGKPVFMMIALLPMTLELSSSFSYDGPTIAVAMVLTAFCFKALYAKKQARSTLIVIFVSSVLLVPLKVVYSFIVLMVLLIPNSSFGDRKVSAIYKTLLALACVAVFGMTRLGTALSIAASDTASYSVRETYDSYSIYDLLEHPLWAAHVFLNSFFERMDFKLFTYLGSNMGQNNLTPLGANTVSAVFLVLLVFSLICADSEARPKTRVIVLSLACFGLASFSIELSMFIGNAERGSDVIVGVLGRYFIPLTPLLIPLMVNTRLSRDYPTPKALFYSAFCLNVLYVVDIFGYIALA